MSVRSTCRTLPGLLLLAAFLVSGCGEQPPPPPAAAPRNPAETAPTVNSFALITSATRHNEWIAVADPAQFIVPAEAVVTLIAAPSGAPQSPTLDEICPLQ